MYPSAAAECGDASMHAPAVDLPQLDPEGVESVCIVSGPGQAVAYTGHQYTKHDHASYLTGIGQDLHGGNKV